MILLVASTPAEHVSDVILVGSSEHPILTMHMVMLVISGLLTWWIMSKAAKGISTGPASQGNDRYITRGRLAQIIEAMSIYLRDQMLVPVLGEKATRQYLPFLLTLFFFILTNNLLGMIPLLDLQHVLGLPTLVGGTATSNIAVTATLAAVSLVVIQIHAFRDLGIKGWLVHHCGGLVPGPIYLLPIALLVFVVEVAGDFMKPIALAIRLFANMLAGHILLAVMLSFGAMAMAAGMGTAGWLGISALSAVFSIAISVLELFVAFLQAFIFMFLTAVFISLLSHQDEHAEHKEEHGHEHEHGASPAHA